MKETIHKIVAIIMAIAVLLAVVNYMVNNVQPDNITLLILIFGFGSLNMKRS